MNPANLPLLIGIIRMNFGMEAAASFDKLFSELREFSVWSETYEPSAFRVSEAFKRFESSIVDHE